jgi:hypothetical protein
VHNDANEEEADMTIGNSRRVALWAAVFLTGGAACSTRTTAPCTCPNHAKEHVVFLQVEKNKEGKKTAVAHPDYITVRGYNPKAPDSVVIWVYHHKSTKITFDPKSGIKDVVCRDSEGKCELTLPPGLEYGTKYKYRVDGADAEGELATNDPYIEVDR